MATEKERLRLFRQQHPEKWRSYQRKWNRQNPLAYKAHKRVENAVKSGKLIPRPCFCGTKAHAHHDDYLKPLEVLWLCPKHHKARHKELKLLGRDPDTSSG
jgi:hypothetical protein